MVVSFTPNIGLAKPDESELAEDWVNSTKLCEDNNLLIIDNMDIVLTSYTPTIIAPTTNPSVGAGSIVGEYCIVEGFVFGNFRLSFTDPGVSAGTGSGAYGISLPTSVDSTFHNVGSALNNVSGTASCIGEGYFYDDGTIGNNGSVALDAVDVAGVDYARMITEAYGGKTVVWVGPTFPSTVSDGDHLTGQFFYKAA